MLAFQLDHAKYLMLLSIEKAMDRMLVMKELHAPTVDRYPLPMQTLREENTSWLVLHAACCMQYCEVGK